MLGIFHKKNADVPAVTIKAEPPVPVAVKRRDGEAEWLELSKKLGVTPARVDRSELELFLEEECIPIYKTQAVFDYLGGLAKASAGGTWEFWPVRNCDRGQTAGYAAVSIWPEGVGNTRSGETYRSAIPLPVLLTMEKIIGKFGSDVHFFVAAVDDDPFLAVRLRDSIIEFVERWDEPSFRG